MGNRQQEGKEGFTIVSLDESFFFFYDCLIRRVWIDGKKRPVVRTIGSHKHSCLFGAISREGKQIFRQYDKFNGDTFLDFLKMIHEVCKMLYFHGQGVTSLQIKEGAGLL